MAFAKTYQRSNRKSISLIPINIIELLIKNIPTKETPGLDGITHKTLSPFKEETPFLHTLAKIRAGNTFQVILWNPLNLTQILTRKKNITSWYQSWISVKNILQIISKANPTTRRWVRHQAQVGGSAVPASRSSLQAWTLPLTSAFCASLRGCNFSFAATSKSHFLLFYHSQPCKTNSLCRLKYSVCRVSQRNPDCKAVKQEGRLAFAFDI